jgi:DNA-binding SARP family transcriptional activator/WD40 repeat protein
VYISKLRKILEPDRSPRAEPSVLLTQAPGYRLAVQPEQVDLFRFEAMAGVARELRRDECVVGTAVVLHEALALWRGPPMADLATEPFARFEVARLEEMRTGAIEDRIEADLALGLAAELLPELDALVARNPYRERLRRQLMVALYRAGLQADAIAAYQAARTALVDDLGLEPGRELRETESAILVHDPDLVVAPIAPITAEQVATVLRAVTRTEPDSDTVESIVAEGQGVPSSAVLALRRTIDREFEGRLSERVASASVTRLELQRTQRAVADSVFDRRVRHAPGDARDEVRASASKSGPVIGACPYRGLLRFEPEDSGWYFGRERLVADLLAVVASTPGAAVVGASGSGKSSLTRAGLVAAIRDNALPGSGRWPRLLVTPGADPMLELAQALAPVAHAVSPDHVRDRLLDDPQSITEFASRAVRDEDDDGALLVVVDQLEEVFTVCRDDALRARFLDVLVHAAADPDCPARVLSAIRADYYGRCAEHSEFAEIVGAATLLVGAMRPDELQRAIEEPARTAGLVLEDGLLDRILDDVGSEPGALPLLETALLETWTRREGNVLTLDGYEATGGVRGAVAHLADDVYARMSSSERAVARAIFLRLAEPGVGRDDVRRRAPLRELVVDAQHAQVLGALVEHRLVVTNDVTAEVAHEALLREWPRLRAWLEEDRQGRRIQRALSNAAQDWESADRNDDLLFRGTRLAAALDVADAHPAEVNPLERDFLGASRAHQDVELRTAQRTTRHLRRLTGALAVLLVVALVASVFSLVQRSRANRNAGRAERAATLSDAQRLVAQADALGEDQHVLQLLLTTEAHRLAPGPETESALFRALTSEPSNDQRLTVFDTQTIFGPGISPDGRRVAVADPGGIVRILDTATKREVRRLSPPPDGQAVAPVFSTDGRWLAVGSVRGSVTVWNVATGRRVAGPLASANGVAYGIFDPATRRRLFIGGHDGVVSAWDLSNPARPHRDVLATTLPPESPSNPLLVVPARRERRLLIGDSDPSRGHPVLVIDTTTGAEIARFEGAPGAISPDGSFIARRRPDNVVEVLDVASGAVVGAPISSVLLANGLMAFDASGARLAVRDNADLRIHVIDWRTGADAVDPIEFVGIPVFLEDGRLFIRDSAASALVDLSVGDTAHEPFIPPIARRFTVAGDIGFSPDGRVVTTSTDGASIVVSDPDDPSRQRTLPIPERLRGDNVFVGASPDRRLVVAFHEGRDGDGNRQIEQVEVVRRATGKSLGSFTSNTRLGYNYWWNDDSSAFWLANLDGVWVWTVGEPEPRRVLGRVDPVGLDFVPRRLLAWRPDGRKLVVAIHDAGTARTFRVPGNGRGRTIFDDDTVVMRGGAMYRSDGRAFALATYDNQDGETRVFVFDDGTGKVIDRYEFDQALASMAYFNGAGRLATLRDATLDQDSATTMFELWDTDGLRPIAATPLQGIAHGLVASPDGTHLMIMYASTNALASPTATVWDMRPKQWVEYACRAADRSLTRSQWKQYLPGLPYDPVCR